MTAITQKIDLARQLHATGTPRHIIRLRTGLSPHVLALSLRADDITRMAAADGQKSQVESTTISRTQRQRAEPAPHRATKHSRSWQEFLGRVKSVAEPTS